MKVASKFVSHWLLGTALFVTGWGGYLSHQIPNSSWLFVGCAGGLVMLHLHAKTEGIDTSKTDILFWAFLFTLTIVAINVALASLGISEDVFGLLGGKG